MEEFMKYARTKTEKMRYFYTHANVYKTTRTKNKDIVLFIDKMTPEIEEMCKNFDYKIANSYSEYAPEIQGVAIITDYRGVF